MANLGRTQPSLRLTESPPSAVVHLVRTFAPDWAAAAERFARSYSKHPAGAAHRLHLVVKAERPQHLDRVRHIFHGVSAYLIEIPDEGFDLGAYRIAAERLTDASVICFLNSGSEILAGDWLGKLVRNLGQPGVGLVSATGSFESMARDRAGFPPFPNPHLRTNAFAIDRTRFLTAMEGRDLSSKTRLWEIESGLDSLTRRIAREGLQPLVVARDGRGYGPRWWPLSETFRLGAQPNLLVADDQTRAFANTPPDIQARIAASTWGTFPQARQSPREFRRLRAAVRDPYRLGR